jgi:hypothetical protein
VQTDGYRLDKSHVFRVNMFDDFEKYSRVPEQYTPREVKPYDPVVSGGVRTGRGANRSWCV